MKITKIEDHDKISFMDLLLLADEDEKMIEKYLYRGEMFALYDDDLKSICVVTQESDDVCELKNIATYEKWHGYGYGSELLNHIVSYYKGKDTTMWEQVTSRGYYSFTRKTGLEFLIELRTFSQTTTTNRCLKMVFN